MKSLSVLLLTLALSTPFAVFAGSAININTAGAEDIAQALTGIGPSRAQAVVAYREANGPFKSVEDLALVKGVGYKTVEKNRDRLTISGSSPSSIE